MASRVDPMGVRTRASTFSWSVKVIDLSLPAIFISIIAPCHCEVERLRAALYLEVGGCQAAKGCSTSVVLQPLA
jgi:hypothetical protein